MENVPAFVLGLIVLCLAVVTVIIPPAPVAARLYIHILMIRHE